MGRRHAVPDEGSDDRLSTRHLKRFHGWATIIWLLLIPITVVFWSNSVAWIALMSVWANFAGHWAAWQAARVEKKQDDT